MPWAMSIECYCGTRKHLSEWTNVLLHLGVSVSGPFA
jgi:hypothetical protein